MRKLIVSMNVTIDGFVAGPDGGLSWHFDRWTQEMCHVQCEHLSKVDTILLGRNTYNVMAPYWMAAKSDISYARDDIAFAHLMNSRQKIVVSDTVDELTWENSKRMTGNLIGEVTRLKNMPGRDIITYGSIKLVTELLKSELTDSHLLWLHPVLLEKGRRLFDKNSALVNMHLRDIKQFGSGVVLLKYDKDPLDHCLLV